MAGDREEARYRRIDLHMAEEHECNALRADRFHAPQQKGNG